MKRVDELGVVTHRHVLVSMKRLTSATMAITAVMGLGYFIVGFPPAFETFDEKMYFHAIGIGLAALATYLIVDVFQLERHEPPLDFPISYRAFGSVVLAALGGLVFLSPTVNRTLPHVGMLLFIGAFILLLDVGGALFIELLVLPRKLAGTYRPDSHNPIQYFSRLIPLTRGDVRAYRGRGPGYWLTLTSVGSFFLAEVIGFLNLWVRELGTSVFAHYISWLGLDKDGFLDSTLDPHSHMIAIAIMAGIVGVAAILFRSAQPGSPRVRGLARAGVWLTILGVVGTTVVLGAVAFFNYEPPTLFTSGPGGVNGMAGDDVVMTVVLLGALILSISLVLGGAARRDTVKLLFAGTWAAVILINVIEGFYIELHETVFQGSGAAKDASFSTAQPMTGIFLMTSIALGLLLLAYYGIDGRPRLTAVWAFGVGLAGAVLGSTLWTFADPSKHGLAFWTYVAGTAVAFLAILGTGVEIRRVKVSSFERRVPTIEAGASGSNAVSQPPVTSNLAQ